MLKKTFNMLRLDNQRVSWDLNPHSLSPETVILITVLCYPVLLKALTGAVSIHGYLYACNPCLYPHYTFPCSPVEIEIAVIRRVSNKSSYFSSHIISFLEASSEILLYRLFPLLINFSILPLSFKHLHTTCSSLPLFKLMNQNPLNN